MNEYMHMVTALWITSVALAIFTTIRCIQNDAIAFPLWMTGFFTAIMNLITEKVFAE